jgi:hypothetical protein
VPRSCGFRRIAAARRPVKSSALAARSHLVPIARVLCAVALLVGTARSDLALHLYGPLLAASVRF